MTQKAVFVDEIFTLHNLRSVGTAAILEILIAFGIAAILIWQQLHPLTVPRQQTPTGVTFPVEPLPLPRTMPVPEQQPPQAPQLSEVPPVQESIPSPTALPVQALPPPISNGRRAAPRDILAEFEAGMKRAIDSTKIYPKGSILKGETGAATVSFDYVNGVVSNVHVDKSSGVRRLDDAAMMAVQKATMPPKPAELAGTDHFVILVSFSLGD